MPAKRKSAFSAVLREAQQQGSEEVSQSNRSTVQPLHSEAVQQQHSDTVLPSSSDTATQQQSEAVRQQNSETVKPLYRFAVDRENSEIAQEAAPLQYSETAERLYSQTVTQSHSKTVKKERKISFYLTPEQERKLDDLAYDFLKRTGKRINRNDIVRYLVDQCDQIPEYAVFG